MRKTILTLAFATCTTAATYAQTTSATTDAVGYNTVTCLPNSDTIVSVPFLNTSDSISSTVSGSLSLSGNNATFTINGVTNLTADQYKDLYYVRFTSGDSEGNIYKITGNTASTVTFDTLGDPVTAVSGDKFTIYKFWTLGTLFPPATQTTFIQAPGAFETLTRSALLTPDVSGVGTNLAPTNIYYILNDNWFKTSGGNANDQILWPDTYFIIRHSNNVTNSTTYRPVGTVDSQNVQIPLFSKATSNQDNFIAIPRPVNIKISDLGFVTSGQNINFEPRSDDFDGTFDRILVFDNSIATQRKAPVKTYFYDGSDNRWERSGINADASQEVINPSEGIIIRKTATPTGNKVFSWTNSASY